MLKRSNVKAIIVGAACVLAISVTALPAQSVQDDVLAEIAQIKTEIDRLNALQTYQQALDERLNVDGLIALQTAQFPKSICNDIESICALLPLSTEQGGARK